MKAAIMGYGTIGSGVYEVLDNNCKITHIRTDIEAPAEL